MKILVNICFGLVLFGAYCGLFALGLYGAWCWFVRKLGKITDVKQG